MTVIRAGVSSRLLLMKKKSTQRPAGRKFESIAHYESILLEEMRHDFKAVTEAVIGFGEKQDRLEVKVNQLDEKIDRECTGIRAAMYVMHQELSGKIDNVRSDLEVVKSDVEMVKTDLAVVKSDLEVVKSDVEMVKTDLAVVKSDLEVVKSDVEMVKTDLAVVKSDLEVVKSDVEMVKADLEIVKSDVKDMSKKVDRIETHLTTHDEELRLMKQAG